MRATLESVLNAVVNLAQHADRLEKRGTTDRNQSRNGSNYLKRIINQHKSPTDTVAGCQLNTFQMLPRYHAESWLTMPTISTVVKILEIRR